MRKRTPAAFTLVELMVSTAVMALLLLVLVSVVNQTSSTWQYTTGKIEQFRSARTGFEAMTTRISQATLNTYWEYERDSNTGFPSRYVRQSELRFISGSARELIGNARDESGSAEGVVPQHVGHAVFFHAPLGFVNDPNFVGLEKLVNTWGYFVEFGSDQESIPQFLKNMPSPPPERFRYRLMELMQPSNELSIFNYTSGVGKYMANVPNNQLYSSAIPRSGTTGREWFTDPLSQRTPPVHMLAENVVALIILPKLAPQEDPTGTKLAGSYKYDTTEEKADPSIDPKNQLPPMVQVTLVAIDERSAERLATGSEMPDFGMDELFQISGESAGAYEEDLEQLGKNLADQRLSYRVFTTNVSMRAARWSEE